MLLAQNGAFTSSFTGQAFLGKNKVLGDIIKHKLMPIIIKNRIHRGKSIPSYSFISLSALLANSVPDPGIRKFLGLPDPDPDPTSSKNSKKALFYSFVTSL